MVFLFSLFFCKDLTGKALRCGGLCVKQHLGYSVPWSGMMSAVGRERESVAQRKHSAQDREFTEVVNWMERSGG